jgi:signal transduction histidine kinase
MSYDNERVVDLGERERLAALGEAAVIFVHEVANPLYSMHIAVQLLEEELTDCRKLAGDRGAAPLRSLKRGIAHLMTLLNDFRACSAQLKLSLRPTSLATIVDNVLTGEALTSAVRNVRVTQLLPPDLPPVAADSEKLKQALFNLCKNAIEAMPQGGTLAIGAHAAHNHVYLEVSDTGVGLPEGVNVLLPFTTTKPHGVGLGLTIVQQIVAAHQGGLTYRSTPGEGTTFRITLPIAPREAPMT